MEAVTKRAVIIMKSTIKIEFDFVKKEPYIQATLRLSEDLRDQMLASFFEALGGQSNILKVRQETLEDLSSGGSSKCYIITPVKGNGTLLNASTNTELFPCIDEDNNMWQNGNEHTVTRPKLIDGVPRRNRVDLNLIPEKAIREAMKRVEEIGADPILTDAIILLEKAFNKVADYLDSNEEAYIQKMSAGAADKDTK